MYYLWLRLHYNDRAEKLWQKWYGQQSLKYFLPGFLHKKKKKLPIPGLDDPAATWVQPWEVLPGSQEEIKINLFPEFLFFCLLSSDISLLFFSSPPTKQLVHKGRSPRNPLECLFTSLSPAGCFVSKPLPNVNNSINCITSHQKQTGNLALLPSWVDVIGRQLQIA